MTEDAGKVIAEIKGQRDRAIARVVELEAEVERLRVKLNESLSLLREQDRRA